MNAGAASPSILAIAGSDSSGGAGLVADIVTARDLRADIRIAITAVTAQSDAAVGGCEAVSAELVGRQIALALEDGAVGAVKIGMLGTGTVAEGVADALADFAGRRPIVLDPVLASTSGARLLDETGIACLLGRLLPMASVVTPNLVELGLLAARLGLAGGSSVPQQAAALMCAGARAVLVKGGHGEGPVAEDILFQRHGDPVRMATARLPAAMRGTGCRLSTAIAVRLAAGDPLETACRAGKAYLTAQLLDRVPARPPAR